MTISIELKNNYAQITRSDSGATHRYTLMLSDEELDNLVRQISTLIRADGGVLCL